MEQGKVEYSSVIIITQKLSNSYDNSPFLWMNQRINPNKTMYLLYQTCGGHLEEIETPHEAAYREMFEETNLNNDNIFKYYGTNQITNNKNRDKGMKYDHVFELITKLIPENTEPINHSEWRLFNFREILSMKCNDTIMFYISQEILRLLQFKNIVLIEGTIGAGKSYIINQFFKKYHCIPEVTVSKRLSKDLKRFYDNEITNEQFQKIIEEAYFEELINILFKVKKMNIILDRNQTSTQIFSIHNGLTNQQIDDIKYNRIYYDTIVKISKLIYIRTSESQMISNIINRAREAELNIDLQYCKKLANNYENYMKIAYKNKNYHVIDNSKRIYINHWIDPNYRNIQVQLKMIL